MEISKEKMPNLFNNSIKNQNKQKPKTTTTKSHCPHFIAITIIHLNQEGLGLKEDKI